MEFWGRGGRTATGKDLKEMISALQKWIRRGNRKAIQAFVELWRMHEIGAKAVQTNVLNRVMVIALEDVGVGPGSLALAASAMEICQRDRDQLKPDQVAAVIERLLSSKKNRLCSFLYNYYTNESGRCLAGLEEPISVEAPALVKLDPRDPVAELELSRCLASLSKALQESSGEAFYWADRFIKSVGVGKHVGKQLCSGKGQTKSPMRLFWRLLEKSGQLLEGTLELYEATFWKRKSAKDARVFWLGPLLGVLLGYREGQFRAEKIPSLENSDEFQAMFSKLEPLEFEPWVLDWHTLAGRNAGATKLDFALESSRVEPEVFPQLPPSFPSVEKLKEIYIAVKAKETTEQAPKRRKV